jgi:hypothetical protein
VDWITWAKEAGVYISPLLMGAVFWLNADRARLIAELKQREARVEELAERLIIVSTELKTFLFNERKA